MTRLNIISGLHVLVMFNEVIVFLQKVSACGLDELWLSDSFLTETSISLSQHT